MVPFPPSTPITLNLCDIALFNEPARSGTSALVARALLVRGVRRPELLWAHVGSLDAPIWTEAGFG